MYMGCLVYSEGIEMYAGSFPWAYNGGYGPHILQNFLQDRVCTLDAPDLHGPVPLLPALQGPPSRS